MELDTAGIIQRTQEILDAIPSHVTLQAAAKRRSPLEVEAVIQAGITQIGENYVQEASPIIELIGKKANWHMIGHLQRNKAKLAVKLFDMIETVDSWRLAKAIDKACLEAGKIMPVLIEINSGYEETKTGVLPENVDALIEKLSVLRYLRVQGLMTMGPRFGDPKDSRPFFKVTRQIFDRLKTQQIPNVEMKYLSMGMSNSYLIAVEEGANIIRIGTKIFGERVD